MKILIIYFTGTYNTKYLITKIASEFKKSPFNEVDEISIDDKSKIVSLLPYDLVIFSYPIYAFNMPIIFDKYVKKLKFIKKQKYIIAKQSGEPLSLNNSSSYSLIKRIQKANGVLINEYHFLLPYNIHFKYDDNFVKELLNYDDKLLKIMFYEFSNNIITTIKFNYLYALNSFLFKIQRLGGPINSLFYKIDESKCIMCKKCLNSCPVHNIKIKNGKITFSTKCIMCMRCSFYCPTNAIKIGMLEKRKVNGAYKLETIEKDDSLKGDFLSKHNSIFYSFFPKKITKVDDKFKEYFVIESK